MVAHLFAWMTGIAAMVLFASSASIAFADGNAPATQPSPKPELAPKDVAKVVVEALGKNDAQDSGIKTTWKFASPENQKMTGPIEKFIPMVKSDAYAPMLNSKSTEVRELSVDENNAAELVIVADADGNKAYYVFQLSKQSDGNLKDCWMTDGVLRVQPKDPGRQPDQPRLKLPDGQSPA